MKVIKLAEAGYGEALIGMGLSHGLTHDVFDFVTNDFEPSVAEFARHQNTVYRAKTVADRLALKDGGHNKFLESISVWLAVQAPRYWWAQFDTYRAGVSKQSESTMHTLMRRPLLEDDFEGGLDPHVLNFLNCLHKAGDFEKLKRHLPESFLQRRVVCTNYKSLRNIIQQRCKHRLEEWRIFCREVRKQVEHPQFLDFK